MRVKILGDKELSVVIEKGRFDDVDFSVEGGERKHPRRPAQQCPHRAQPEVPALGIAHLRQVWLALRGERQRAQRSLRL